MAYRLVDPEFLPMRNAGIPLVGLQADRDDIELTALGTAEVITHPVAVGHEHASNGLYPSDLIEMRGFLAGHMATPVDLTLKAYRVPIDKHDDIADWHDKRADDPFYTKNIDYSTVGSTPGAELVTGGTFTDVLDDTGGSTTAGDATVGLDAATDLSAVVAGQKLWLNGRTDGHNGTAFFTILSANDGADTVEVTPTPSETDTGITWYISTLGWEVGAGWSNMFGTGVYGPGLNNARGGKLEQAVSMTAASKYLLTFSHTENPSDSGPADGLSAWIGDQLIRRANRVGANNTYFERASTALGGADTLEFRMSPGTTPAIAAAEIDGVTLNEVIPFWFSDVRRVDEADDLGCGSGIAYGFLPTASMALTFLSVWYRRWREV